MKGTFGAGDASAPVEAISPVEEINIEALLEQRLSPGIMVLAPPLQLLHINASGWDLIRMISESEFATQGHRKQAKGLFPPSLQQLCAEIFQHLRDRPYPKDWERFEVKKIMGPSARRILVRGLGVPDQNGRHNTRIVLLLEEIGRRKQKEKVSHDLTQRFQLTEREHAVLQCLAKGSTNKEIATALSLALPTVKEHIRHIMEKTKTNTRTGILMQVFCT